MCVEKNRTNRAERLTKHSMHFEPSDTGQATKGLPRRCAHI